MQDLKFIKKIQITNKEGCIAYQGDIYNFDIYNELKERYPHSKYGWRIL